MDAIKEAAHKTFMKLVDASEKAYAEQNLTPEYYAACLLKRLKCEGCLEELELLFTVFLGHGVTTGMLVGLSPPLSVVLPPQPKTQSQPLTFEELEMGDYFVAFPTDGDDSGHGGFRRAVWLMRKLGADYHDPLRNNYLRMYDHQKGHLPAHFAVYKVGL